MSTLEVQRKDLWASLGRIKFRDWEKALPRLGLIFTQPNGGSSHFVARRNTNPIDYSLKGMITTIYPKMFRISNEKVFKELLRHGFEENEIWEALYLL